MNIRTNSRECEVEGGTYRRYLIPVAEVRSTFRPPPKFPQNNSGGLPIGGRWSQFRARWYTYSRQKIRRNRAKNERTFRLSGTPENILRSRQGKNENENRVRAYALICGYGGWRHLDDGAAGSHGR